MARGPMVQRGAKVPRVCWLLTVGEQVCEGREGDGPVADLSPLGRRVMWGAG